ncbi:acyltransferase [Parabacteroides johnsonii]|uniref:acyltransferase n=1 Tax=Parabacteroides johnsonii TaxID=387661 RepID=UPI002432000C|nr:acyltransferase [Parabacteroides johnsonii]
MIKQKSCHIETLRGIAILLVVLGHVIGSTSEGGMKVANDSFFRYLYDLFVNIRMPLFTVISGWVYALHPVKADNISIFLRKKVRRLLFPMVFVGSLYFLLQYFIPGTNNKMVLPDIWKIYIFPYSIYWYLPALFLVFIGIAICDIRKYLNTISRWYILMIVACLLCYSELTGIIPRSVPNYFAFKNAFYLSPFFLTGVGIVRFKERLSSPVMLKIYLAGLIIGIVLQQMNFFYPILQHFIPNIIYQSLLVFFPPHF